MNARFLTAAFAIFIATGMSAGYSDVDVTHEFSKDANFNNYKTYAWLPDVLQDASSLNPVPKDLDAIIKDTVNQDLAQKGFRESPINEADLVVVYTASVQQKEKVMQSGFNPGAPYFGAGANVDRYGSLKTHPLGFGTNQSFTTYYKEGNLILDFYDRATHKLVWRGTGVKAVENGVTREKQEKNIKAGIGKILKNFPQKS